MTKFKRVLSYKELQEIVEELMWSIGDSFGFGMDVANAVQDAILAKIGEQEPVAWIDVKKLEAMHKDSRLNRVQWKTELRVSQAEDDEIPLYTHPMPCASTAIDKTACVSENEESDTQSGYIPDIGKITPDMYWISDEFPTETILDAFDTIMGITDVSVGDTFEVNRAKTLPSITVEVTEVSEYGDVKAYKVLSGDHIPYDSKRNVPEGYAIVPAEADQALLISMACCLNHGFGLLDKEAQDSMLNDMEKLYNEVVGAGYYSPEVRGRYLNMISDLEDKHP